MGKWGAKAGGKGKGGVVKTHTKAQTGLPAAWQPQSNLPAAWSQPKGKGKKGAAAAAAASWEPRTDGAKGKGAKGKGKAAGKAPPQVAEESPGYAGPRERVGGKKRMAGRVSAWKGPYGWIVADEEIDHPLAGLRQGKIYLDQVDVEKELSGVGARVTFMLYADESGLGACHVVPVKEGAEVPKAAEKGTKKGEGKAAQKGEGKAAQKGAQKGAVQKVVAKEVKGKGKAKGVGKAGKATKAAEVAGAAADVVDVSERTDVAEGPFTGTVTVWKGSIGFIKPDDFEHEDLAKGGRNKGALFVHKTDVEGDEVPLINAIVLFSVHHNGRSLGAHAVQIVEQGDGVKPAKEPKLTSDEGVVDVDGEEEGGESGKKQGKGKGKGKKKGVVATNLKAVGQTLKANKLKEKGAAKGKGKGKKGKGTNQEAGTAGTASGPNLPRERVTAELVSGEVFSFRGRIGWIVPSEEISDPEAKGHGGKLYTFIKDVTGGEALEKGDQVQFHVYKDSQGLGAEEVIKL